MLKTDKGQASLIKMFELDVTPKTNLHDMFVNNFGMGAAYFPAQGNDPLCTENFCNIKKICEFMVKDNEHVSNLDKIIHIRKVQNSISSFSSN